MNHTIEATFQGAQRLINSRDGNPQYRVFTMNGSYLTKVDAQVNFEVTNHIGKPVRLTLDADGHIIGISPME
jgi:hypothetical protein